MAFISTNHDVTNGQIKQIASLSALTLTQPESVRAL
jgi:hypothetical protein